jgi:hypothetical protein
MQYGVPQFINVEDKIVGPFTGKQTLCLIIGGGLLMLFFSVFDFIFFAILAMFIIPVTLAFAFWKPKGISVSRLIMNKINFSTSQRFYVWRREPDARMFKANQKKISPKEAVEKDVSRSRIEELAWLLDTSTSVNLPYEVKTRVREKIKR